MTDPRQGQDVAARAGEIREWLVGKVAARVGIDPRRIDLAERFSRYGIDSLKAAGITAELSTFLGRPLPRTLLWDHPSIAAVMRHLTAAPERRRRDRDCALGSEPASRSRSSAWPAAFRWRPIPRRSGSCCVDGIDAISRSAGATAGTSSALFSADPAVPGKMSTRWGGFLDRSRPVRSAVLRDLAARGGADGSAAAVWSSSWRGRRSKTRASGRAR